MILLKFLFLDFLQDVFSSHKGNRGDCREYNAGKDSTPHQGRKAAGIPLAGITFCVGICIGEGDPSNTIGQGGNGSTDRIMHGRNDGRDTHGSKGFKDVLMRSLDAVEGLDILGSSLRVQIRQAVSFIDLLFPSIFGEFDKLGSGLSHDDESMNESPEREGSQQQWSRTEQSGKAEGTSAKCWPILSFGIGTQ